jgi:hypothetical protein
MLYEGGTWNAMPSAIEPRLSDRTIGLGYTLLWLVATVPLALTRF